MNEQQFLAALAELEQFFIKHPDYAHTLPETQKAIFREALEYRESTQKPTLYETMVSPAFLKADAPEMVATKASFRLNDLEQGFGLTLRFVVEKLEIEGEFSPSLTENSLYVRFFMLLGSEAISFYRKELKVGTEKIVIKEVTANVRIIARVYDANNQSVVESNTIETKVDITKVNFSISISRFVHTLSKEVPTNIKEHISLYSMENMITTDNIKDVRTKSVKFINTIGEFLEAKNALKINLPLLSKNWEQLITVDAFKKEIKEHGTSEDYLGYLCTEIIAKKQLLQPDTLYEKQLADLETIIETCNSKEQELSGATDKEIEARLASAEVIQALAKCQAFEQKFAGIEQKLKDTSAEMLVGIGNGSPIGTICVEYKTTLDELKKMDITEQAQNLNKVLDLVQILPSNSKTAKDKAVKLLKEKYKTLFEKNYAYTVTNLEAVLTSDTCIAAIKSHDDKVAKYESLLTTNGGKIAAITLQRPPNKQDKKANKTITINYDNVASTNPLTEQGKDDNSGVHVDDIKQGAVEDCFLLSGVGAIAKLKPELFDGGAQSLIKKTGTKVVNGIEVAVYTVSLYVPTKKGKQKMDVEVEAAFFKKESETVNTTDNVTTGKTENFHAETGIEATKKKKNKNENEDWVAVLEKAFATLAQATKDVSDTRTGYEILDAGGYSSDPMDMLLGDEFVPAKFYLKNGSEELVKILTLNKDNPLTIGTKPSINGKTGKSGVGLPNKKQPKPVYLYAKHEYMIENFDITTQIVTLRNPHNTDGVKDETGTLIADRLGGQVFTLTPAELLEDFDVLRYMAKK